MPAALVQRRRPSRGAWGRRRLVGGAWLPPWPWSWCGVGAALTPGCRRRHARSRPLRRLPGRACLPVSGALLFLAPSLDGFCLRNASFPARCAPRERRAQLSGTRGRDRMRFQTNKKFRGPLLSMMVRAQRPLAKRWWLTADKIKRDRPTGIKILFVASACCFTNAARALHREHGLPCWLC